MNLLPDAHQEQLVEPIGALLTERFPKSRLLGDDHGRPSTEEWRKLGDLGWFGLGLGEDDGGVGAGPAEEMLAFVEFGRHLLPGPALGSVLGAHAAALAGDAKTARAIAEGEHQVGLFVDNDHSGYIVDGADAPLLLIVSERDCRLVDADDFDAIETIDCIDTTVDLQRVKSKPPEAQYVLIGEAAARLHLRGTVLAAAFQVGIAQATLQQTLGYVMERHQFDQPIGGFQAVKHRCADMAIRAEAAWSITALAALSVDGDDAGHAQVQASAAKAVADSVARFNAATNIQNHGGVGYTWEYGAHLFVSRAEVFGELIQPSLDALRTVLEAPA